MNTPTITFRVRQDRQAEVRELVNSVKDDPELIGLLLEYIRNEPPPEREAMAADESIGPFRNAEAALSVLTTERQLPGVIRMPKADSQNFPNLKKFRLFLSR